MAYLSSNGYRVICKNSKHYYEHRVVMESIIGRPLKSSEHVHHINGNKTDNNGHNLELLNASQHHSLHARKINLDLLKAMLAAGRTVAQISQITGWNKATIAGNIHTLKLDYKHSLKHRKAQRVHICKQCGKLFDAQPSNRRTFCSRKCLRIHLKRNSKLTCRRCMWCNKKFLTYTGQFCSYECAGKAKRFPRNPETGKFIKQH